MTKIFNFALKIKGVVGRVAHAKSSDPATPPKKIWNVHLPEFVLRKNAWLHQVIFENYFSFETVEMNHMIHNIMFFRLAMLPTWENFRRQGFQNTLT